MQTPDDAASASRQRLERHNISVDEELADADRCGQVHLASGRRCARPARHRGSCDFVARDVALAVRSYSG